MSGDSKKGQWLKKIVKSKLFWASMSFYLLAPIIFVVLYFTNVSYTTAGVYTYYENDNVVSVLTIGRNNKASITFKEGFSYSDKDYIDRNKIAGWRYHSSRWGYSLDPTKYSYISLEYIDLLGEDNGVLMTFFIIDHKLYSAFLAKREAGEFQKCYTKK